MIRGRLFIALRSVMIGWTTLLLVAFLLKQPLLFWTAPIIGVKWLATAGLALDCTALAATGWVVGRLNRARLRLRSFSKTGRTAQLQSQTER